VTAAVAAFVAIAQSRSSRSARVPIGGGFGVRVAFLGGVLGFFLRASDGVEGLLCLFMLTSAGGGNGS
jgi:hypothetical protein